MPPVPDKWQGVRKLDAYIKPLMLINVSRWRVLIVLASKGIMRTSKWVRYIPMQHNYSAIPSTTCNIVIRIEGQNEKIKMLNINNLFININIFFIKKCVVLYVILFFNIKPLISLEGILLCLVNFRLFSISE
jgi:hypothetical protein